MDTFLSVYFRNCADITLKIIILCKNKATFRISATNDITPVSKAKQYEIYIACILMPVTDKATLIEACSHVLKTICDTLDQVISKMKCKQYLSSFYRNVYELVFKCPEHSNSDQLVINRPRKRGSNVLSHSAKHVWLNYHEGKSVMVCLEKEREIAFAEKLPPSIA